MSSRATRSFLADLRRLDAELVAPIPERVRFLEELEYDLEALHEGLVARGMAAEEARHRALDALVPDPGTLRELARVHASVYRRITGSVGPHKVRMLERGALALATASVLVVQAAVLARADLLGGPSPFLWPVLGLGALLFAACTAKAFELGIVRDHRAPGRGLGGILALSAGVLTVGFTGALVDTWVLAATLERAPHLTGTLGLAWLVRECALLAVAILVALAGGLGWFVLSQWVSSMSGARHQVLGLTPTAEESSR